MFSASHFYSNAPENLQKAQQLMEDYITAFAEAADLEADALQLYREKRGKLLLEALQKGTPVTAAGDLIRGECAGEKSNWLKANSQKTTLRYRIEAMKERIYSIRHLCKGIESQIKIQ